MKKFLLIIAAILVLGAGLIAVCFFTIMGAVKPVSDAAEAFMTSLKDEKYDAAYGMMTGPVQKHYGSGAALKEELEREGLVPEKWSFNQTSMNTDTSKGTTGKVEGRADFKNKSNGTITIELLKWDGIWKIVGFLFDTTH